MPRHRDHSSLSPPPQTRPQLLMWCPKPSMRHGHQQRRTLRMTAPTQIRTGRLTALFRNQPTKSKVFAPRNHHRHASKESQNVCPLLLRPRFVSQARRQLLLQGPRRSVRHRDRALPPRLARLPCQSRVRVSLAAIDRRGKASSRTRARSRRASTGTLRRTRFSSAS